MMQEYQKKTARGHSCLRIHYVLKFRQKKSGLIAAQKRDLFAQSVPGETRTACYWE